MVKICIASCNWRTSVHIRTALLRRVKSNFEFLPNFQLKNESIKGQFDETQKLLTTVRIEQNNLQNSVKDKDEKINHLQKKLAKLTEAYSSENRAVKQAEQLVHSTKQENQNLMSELDRVQEVQVMEVMKLQKIHSKNNDAQIKCNMIYIFSASGTGRDESDSLASGSRVAEVGVNGGTTQNATGSQRRQGKGGRGKSQRNGKEIQTG